jgi:predicted nucleic acid-binding protein
MIASIAISNNLILVTRNVSDFTTIAENSNLMIENWFGDAL